MPSSTASSVVPAHPNNKQIGQATVEFALVVPLVGLCAITLVAVVALCLNVLALNDIARNSARAAATSPDPQQAASTIAASRGATAIVHVSHSTGLVTVRVTQPARLFVIGSWLPTVQLSAHASIMQEPPIVLG
jgi:Flp pilus assembly protein TadG